MPCLIALSATCCADICPANGVLFRLPLKPLVPALAQQSTSPLVSVIVIVVLLNVALMWATPTVTLRRTFRRAWAACADCGFGFAKILFAPLENRHKAGSAMLSVQRYGCHITHRYRISLTPFFPATVFLGPL